MFRFDKFKNCFWETTKNTERIGWENGVSVKWWQMKTKTWLLSTWSRALLTSNWKWRRKPRRRAKEKSTSSGKSTRPRWKRKRKIRSCSSWKPQKLEAPGARRAVRAREKAKRKSEDQDVHCHQRRKSSFCLSIALYPQSECLKASFCL